MFKLPEHSNVTFHKMLASRRILERQKTDKSFCLSRQNRPDHGLGFSLYWFVKGVNGASQLACEQDVREPTFSSAS